MPKTDGESGRVAQHDRQHPAYALSEDGLWREHSWGVAGDGSTLETTEPRVAYFGVTMDGERAQWFADWIEPERIDPGAKEAQP